MEDWGGGEFGLLLDVSWEPPAESWSDDWTPAVTPQPAPPPAPLVLPAGHGLAPCRHAWCVVGCVRLRGQPHLELRCERCLCPDWVAAPAAGPRRTTRRPTRA